MKTPIINKLKKYMEKNPISFHTPGHKNRMDKEFTSMLGSIDITEIYDSDSLFSPHGIIKESQEEIAKVYKAAYSFLNVEGSTTGNYIAMGGLSKAKDKVLIQRNSHKSVYNGLILNDLIPVYINSDFNKEFEFASEITEDSIKHAFKLHPDIRLVLLTSPNYYGIVLDIKKISKLVHDHGCKLIVDEAHGSHFNFLDQGPKSALHQGADLVINSAHKTLPSMTQSSLIHLANKEDIKAIRESFNLYMTTSPSYVLMASLEYGIAYMDKYGLDKLREMVPYIRKMKKTLDSLENVHVFKYDEDYLDPLRIVFNIDGFTGGEISCILREKYNINMEMNDHKNIVGFFSVKTTREDLDTLQKAICEIAEDKRKALDKLSFNFNEFPKIKVLPREAYYKDKKLIKLNDAVGEIAGNPIIPYPPGIPLVVAGELISKEIVDYVNYLLEKEIHIIGIDEGEIKVIK